MTEGIIETDLYVKSTDSQQYLSSSSYDLLLENYLPIKKENRTAKHYGQFDSFIDDRYRKVFPGVPSTGFKKKKFQRPLGKVTINRYKKERHVLAGRRNETSLSFVSEYKRHSLIQFARKFSGFFHH